MDPAGLYRCSGTAADGEQFVRFVSLGRGGSALAQFRSSCDMERIDYQAVTVYRCDPKGLPLGRPLLTWEKPLRW
jgi:hypothetical protein